MFILIAADIWNGVLSVDSDLAPIESVLFNLNGWYRQSMDVMWGKPVDLALITFDWMMSKIWCIASFGSATKQSYEQVLKWSPLKTCERQMCQF